MDYIISYHFLWNPCHWKPLVLLVGYLLLMIDVLLQGQELHVLMIDVLGSNLTCWLSHRQWITACSSIEAEYRSLAQTSTELTWISTLLTEMKVSFTNNSFCCKLFPIINIVTFLFQMCENNKQFSLFLSFIFFKKFVVQVESHSYIASKFSSSFTNNLYHTWVP